MHYSEKNYIDRVHIKNHFKPILTPKRYEKSSDKIVLNI